MSSLPQPLDFSHRNLVADLNFDSKVIKLPDKIRRRAMAAELLEALCSQDLEEQERARQLFFDQGHFDETIHNLKTADSPAKRAAAARSLGIVGSPLATASLVAALFDTDAEVRRAGIEALGQIGDPEVASASLNAIAAKELPTGVKKVGPRHSAMKNGRWRADLGLEYVEFQWLFIAFHVAAAGGLIMSSAIAIQFLVLPFWLGGLFGFLLYLLTLYLDSLVVDEEQTET